MASTERSNVRGLLAAERLAYLPQGTVLRMHWQTAGDQWACRDVLFHAYYGTTRKLAAYDSPTGPLLSFDVEVLGIARYSRYAYVTVRDEELKLRPVL